MGAGMKGGYAVHQRTLNMSQRHVLVSWDRQTLCGLQVFQHFGASFMINLTCHEETVVWEEEGLLCRGMLNPLWVRVHPASRCAKLCIQQQTLMEVLNSFIVWFST